MNKLVEICDTKRIEVGQRRAEKSVTALDHLAVSQSPSRGFEAALRKASDNGFALIAEIKKASPSNLK